MPSDPLNPKRRGRPRKQTATTSQGKAMGNVEQNGIGFNFADNRQDHEVINEVLERFNVLRKLAKGIGEHKVRSLILSGKAGIGKTYTLLKILEQMEKMQTTKFHKHSGYITTPELYRMLYEHRHEDCVIMLDDTDNIFYDDDSLNILKAALDTIEHRVISYRVRNMTVDASELTEGDETDEVPNEFEFKGCIVFVTNIDFHAFLAAGRNRVTPHIEALLNRSLYLDMALHSQRAVTLWIRYMMQNQKMLLQPMYGMTEQQSNEILDWIVANQDRIHKPSLRTAVKLAELVAMDPADWKVMANVVMRKPVSA